MGQIGVIALVVGEAETNCYLVVCSETKDCLVIDPGDEANFISEKILQLRLTPTAIIATHGHSDHLLAVKELQLAFEIPFLIHKKDQKMTSFMNFSAKKWLKGEVLERPPQVSGYLEEDSIVKFGNCFLRVAHLPGHTPGGICLYSLGGKIAFVGDLIFENGIGRTDFKYSSPADLHRSLAKITSLAPHFLIYPGHGKEFYL